MLLNAISDSRQITMFECDFLWLFSFYTDTQFLQLYKIETSKNIQILKDNCKNDFEKKNKLNVLANKFFSTNFNRQTLNDSILILYSLLPLLNKSVIDIDFATFYDIIIDRFSVLGNIDKNKVKDYINNNSDVFNIIYRNALSVEDDFTEVYIRDYKKSDKTDIPTEKIDTTSKEGVEKLEVVRSILKQLAKDKSQYKCVLKDLNGCNYFTSKEENKNFLEIHHLVPREFSYEYADTIEFVENYIPLCPNCHRRIHKAVDRERKDIIRYLFNLRINDLKKNNIDIKLNTLFEYYKIDKENR